MTFDEWFESQGLRDSQRKACEAAWEAATTNAWKSMDPDILMEYGRTDGRREWVSVGAWLSEGRCIAAINTKDDQ